MDYYVNIKKNKYIMYKVQDYVHITGSAACRNLHDFEDTKGAIRICKSKKDRQYNDQMKKYKQRSTNHTQKNKDPH
jgi:hypothetical protein